MSQREHRRFAAEQKAADIAGGGTAWSDGERGVSAQWVGAIGISSLASGGQKLSGFTDQPSAFLKWIGCGLEVIRRSSAAHEKPSARSTDDPVLMLPSPSV